ncbi:ExbD/TolR family protein [Inquilinus limosus]|jgi:biopolymer transport protein ExbD|uniref:Biopolymer transporter ExbD n=1 Tax=Inquilinus limosus MP06 TaxID=1398085 RepID=A0A0A0CX33_9PROT|nr:biopolymer transporter ExbD [Inquilinus limosus]KGM30203.1 biopolymer transporter ExbD [Inquilinus limosus MP06]
MQVQSENKPYDDINVTPMLDLAYVLLLIFIIMTTAAVQGIEVNLPKASAAASMSQPQMRAISIDNQGQVFLDTIPVSMPELESRIAQIKATVPDFPVVIKADQAVQYARVMDVLDLLRRVGVQQVGLVSQRPAAG